MELRDSCPICGLSSTSTVFVVPYDASEVIDFLDSYYDGRVDIGYISDEDLEIEYCDDCDFFWHKRILDGSGMEALYDEWISPDESRERWNDWRRREEVVIRASHIPTYFDCPPEELQVLDYGAGWGVFSLVANAYGCNVEVFEFSESRQSWLSQRGLRVHANPDTMETGSYDVIYLNEVLEHVPDPDEVMARISDLLSPDGLCYVSVPNADCRPTTASVLQKGPFQPPEHINGFTRPALERLADKHDLVEVHPSPSLIVPSITNFARKTVRQAFASLGVLDRFLGTTMFLTRCQSGP